MYYPVALNLDGRRVVVLGGDEEAARKVEDFLGCGAAVTVVSPSVSPRIELWAQTGRITLAPRAYRDGDLAEAFLAVACDADVGAEARAEATQRGVLFNVLDQTELCDFIAVATFTRAGLQFGVHSSGNSAALTRRIRERLQRQFDERYGKLTDLLGELRPRVRQVIATAKARRRFWLQIVDEHLLARVEHGLDMDELREDIWVKAEEFDSLGSEIAKEESPDPPEEAHLADQEARRSCPSR